jgi:hypothetical protein
MKTFKNKKALLAVVLVALIVALGGWKYCHAGPRNCSLGQKLVDGFALTGGFRWDRECSEATPCRPQTPVDHTGHHDPAFIGAELRLPLASWATAGGNFDRDWTDAPDWNARVYVAFAPWRRPKQSR